MTSLGQFLSHNFLSHKKCQQAIYIFLLPHIPFLKVIVSAEDKYVQCKWMRKCLMKGKVVIEF